MIRKGIRIAIIALVVVVVLALTAVVVVWQTRRPMLAARLQGLAQAYLIDNDSTRIEIGGMSGNPLGAVKLQDVSLLVRDGPEWRAFLTAKSVKVDFSLSRLSKHAVELKAVEVERPVFSLDRGRLGKYLWPRFKKSKGPRTGPGFKIDIQRVSLSKALFKIDRRKEDMVFSGIDLVTSLKLEGDGGVALGGVTASFTVRPWEYEVKKMKGNIFLTGSSVGFGSEAGSDSLWVSTPFSTYSVRGRYEFGDEKLLDLELLLDRLSLEEMRRFQSLSFLPDSGQLAGRASVTQAGRGPTTVKCRMSGQYGKHPIESLDASAEVGRGGWRSEFRLLSDRSVLEGTFNAQAESLQECAIDFKSFDPGQWPDVFGQDKLPHGSMDGAFRFSGKSLTSSERQGEFEVILDGGNYAGFSFLHAGATGEFDGRGGLAFPGIEVRGAGYGATATGSVGVNGTLQFDFDGQVKNLAEFSWVRNQFDLSGNLNVSGRLDGDREKLLLDATVYGPLAGTTPGIVSGTLTEGVVKGQLWPVVSLGTSAKFSPGALFGFSADAIDARAVLSEGGGQVGGQQLPGLERLSTLAGRPAKMLMMANLKAQQGDTSLTAEASLRLSPGVTQTGVTELAFAAGGTTWKSPGPFSVDWERGTLTVSGMRLASDKGTLSLDGSFEPKAKKTNGKLAVDVTDVAALAGRFAPVKGRLTGTVEAERSQGATRLRADLDWRDASLSGRTFDRLSLSASADEKEINIGRMDVLKGDGTIGVSGRFVLPSGLAGLVDTLSNRHSLPAGTSADVKVTLQNLDVADLADWHPALRNLGGRLSGSAQVEGALERPRIRLSATGTDVRIKQYEVSGIETEASLADGVCNVSHLDLVEKNARGTVVGSFPLRVDLSKGKIALPDGPLDLDVRLSESDFAVASLFIKQIAASSGLVQGSVKMSGTVKDPSMQGAFSITNATMRLAGREEVFENLEAQVRLDEKTLDLVEFSATQGKEGRIEGSGRINIGEPQRGQYSFVVKGKKVTFGDPEDVAMKFDCDLVISSVEVPDKGTLPKITGRIDVKEGVIAREFTSGTVAGGESRWLCDVELEVPNNLWLKNIDAEIELAGSLTARKENGGMILLGTLQILRGKYYVFDNEFRIVSGSLEFKDVGRIDPELNIEAETSASGRRIQLFLTGKLSEPTIRFASEDENLTQQKLLELLTVGKYVESEGQTVVPGVGGTVGNYFLRQIERRLARELKWVDSIELGGSLEGVAAFNELRWGLGKYVTPELYLRYSQGLVKTSERDVSIEYRLSELLFLRGGVASKDRLAGRDRDEYTLDLRLKYEY